MAAEARPWPDLISLSKRAKDDVSESPSPDTTEAPSVYVKSLNLRIPDEAFVFLSLTTLLLILIIFAFLYINKVACFKSCGGKLPFIDRDKPAVKPLYSDAESSESEDDCPMKR